MARFQCGQESQLGVEPGNPTFYRGVLLIPVPWRTGICILLTVAAHIHMICPARKTIHKCKSVQAMHRAVDIILPTHRRPHTVGYSIQSVLLQTYPSFHLHVVGDGCSPETESVVRSFRDSRVHFYPFGKGKGFGYVHRNAVLRQTSEKYVAYIADDDLLFPDHLERGVAALEGRSLGLVAFRACHVRAPDRVDAHFFAFDWQIGFVSKFLRHWFTGMAEYIHRRDLFEQVGYWDAGLSRFGDREFYNRLRTSGAPSTYLDYMTVLRFYAQDWDDQYSSLEEPPQKRYLARLQDPGWCEAVRNSGETSVRGFRSRQQQWRDFFAFAVRSGPKFLRFGSERLSTYLQREEGHNATGSQERPSIDYE